MARTVHCTKLNEELEGLDFVPFSNDIGQRIYDNLSKQAWQMWINEYRLNLATTEGQEVYDKHLEEFFFGDSTEMPAGYRPPQSE